jgi:hypothetical protein
MEGVIECSYEGCRNKRQHLATGLCAVHRRMQIQTGELRPLRLRSRIKSPTCTGPECSRPSESYDLCKQHAQQRRSGNPLHVIGDRSYVGQRSRERWAALSEAERAAWVAAMQAGMPRSKTEDQIRKMSEANRAAWARKYEDPTPTDRDCLTCGNRFTFQPTLGGRQFYCSIECRRLYGRLRKHGLTFRQYSDMLAAQGGVCAICRGPWKGWNGQNGSHIDHCHKTGRVRGILCGDCNTAIGRFGDDPVLLRRAAAYLEG